MKGESDQLIEESPFGVTQLVSSQLEVEPFQVHGNFSHIGVILVVAEAVLPHPFDVFVELRELKVLSIFILGLDRPEIDRVLDHLIVVRCNV